MKQTTTELFKATQRLSQKVQRFTNNVNSGVKLCRPCMKKLASRGWIFAIDEFGIADFNQIKLIFKNKNYRRIDEIFGVHAEKSIERVIKTTTNYYPDREEIITEAIQAHENSKYIFSVPILLSQAEYMFRDMFNLSPYKKLDKQDIISQVPQIYNSLEKIDRDFVFNYSLLPFYNNPVSKSNFSGNPRTKNNRLSRDEIMHGVSADYNTRINSAKSIALLYSILNLKRYI